MADQQSRVAERANSIARQIAQTPTEDRAELYRRVAHILRGKSQNFQATHFIILEMREKNPDAVRFTNG